MTRNDSQQRNRLMHRGGDAWARRETRLIMLVLAVLIVAVAAWLGVRILQARSNLEAARDSAQLTRQALLDGDIGMASQDATAASLHAQRARTAAHSLPWTMAAAIPWLGGPFETSRQITDVVDRLATTVLLPATKIGAGMSPSALLENGRLDVARLRTERTALEGLAASADRVNADAERISDPRYLSAVGSARAQLQQQTSDLDKLLGNTALAAQIGPAMTGADGPRAYLMAFQTNAEARGTGGLLGGFGILRFDNGKPTVDNLASNRDLIGSSAAVDLGGEFTAQYGFTNPFTDFRNSNLSSHFPYAAQIWKSMWERQSDVHVDGVIALDPVTLSYILGAVGPVTMPDGETITQDNVVELTESAVYDRFPTDQTARKAYLQDIASAVVRKMTEPVKSPHKLLDALGKASSQRRIAVWSSIPAEQAVLERTPLGHQIPDDASPYAEVVVNNLAGNKMDYYLKRAIEYAADDCGSDMRNSTVTVRLANSAQPNKPLSDYAGGATGLSQTIPIKIPVGTMVTSVRVIATKGAKLLSVMTNGQRIPAITHHERGHPTFEVQVVIPPGQSGELSFQFSEPSSPGPARVPVQPLIDDVKPRVAVPECPAMDNRGS